MTAKHKTQPEQHHHTPYGWVIEYTPRGSPPKSGTIFIRNDGSRDRAYVMQRAVDLRGEVLAVFTWDRRK